MSDGEPTASARSDLRRWRRAAVANRFESDAFFERLLRRHLADRFDDWVPRLRQVAEDSGARFGVWVAESNHEENLPVLRRHDADGRPTEEVVFHPSYHAVGRVFWASGVLSVLATPGCEVASGAIAYLLDQHGEAGHACPVACTAGAIKLLQKVGTNDQRERYLPSLLQTDYDQRLHAAQFVTEVQGGSDVGSNACLAFPEPGQPGWYRISGEKWFCSVADAGLFVVSARPADAPGGTGGLGLFLVPRVIDGRPNGFSLRRLKTKLGTRSMATGEVEFDGALGEAIGPLEHGFRNLVGIVLDTSRAHNAVAACGLMRRAYVEALRFAENRRAFERPIVDFPAVREILARMRVRTACALLTTFRILALTDRLAVGEAEDDLVATRRIAVMINKYWTSVASTLTVREAIEILGGNGTIEEFSVLPRLYRDAIVIESWEGTHNTLCAQVLRDFAVRRLHVPWLRQAKAEIDELTHAALAEQAARARELHADVAARIARVLASEPEQAAAHIRHVVDRMCRLTDFTVLVSQAQWDLDHGQDEAMIDVLEWYRRSAIDVVDPLDGGEWDALHLRVSVSA
ncbi:MAG: acyl-CoA dehydrogenase family protein [Acidobacteriota bacterium]|nr:MAG: acyl-CoA dehydrogenase family protein [Acidobacteriota bacterium]